MIVMHVYSPETFDFIYPFGQYGKKKSKILSKYPEGKYYEVKIDAAKNQLEYMLLKENVEYDY